MTTLTRLLHRCTLALDVAAAAESATPPASPDDLTLEDGDAFDAYRRAVARSGGDGQRVCADAAAVATACPPIAPARSTSTHLRRRKSKKVRCAMVINLRPSNVSPSADKTIFARHVVANYSRSVPASLGIHADFIGLLTPLRGSIYCDTCPPVIHRPRRGAP